MILWGLVVVAIAIGMAIFGSHVLGNVLSNLPNFFVQNPKEMTGLSDANTDGELRFYSVFFAAYGIGLILWSRDVLKNKQLLLAAFVLFFLGGLARGLSIVQVGAPHLLFQVLFFVELLLPPVMAAWLWMIVKRV